ncbi:hypothetical protein RYX36_015328 [Vicia faba]
MNAILSLLKEIFNPDKYERFIIVMEVLILIAAFFVLICYHRLKYGTFFPLPQSSSGDVRDLQLQPTTVEFHRYHHSHTQGLNESVINIIPSFIYSTNNEQKEESPRDCAVCLVEFKDDDYVRKLPLCSHTFHLHCVDTWLRSHPNCPLCRSCLRCDFSELPFRPLMSERIRPSSVMQIALPTLPTRGSV